MPKDAAPLPDNAADSTAATDAGHQSFTDEDEYPAPQPVVETVVEDEDFGAITVRLDTQEGEVTVEGESVPRVVLRQTPGPTPTITSRSAPATARFSP